MKAKTVVISLGFILLLALGILTLNQYLKASELQNIMLSSQESLNIAFSNRNTQIDSLLELVTDQTSAVEQDEVQTLQAAQKSISQNRSVAKNSAPGEVYQTDTSIRKSLNTLVESIPADSSLLNNTSYQTTVKEIKNSNSVIEENFKLYNQNAADFNHEIKNFPFCLIAPFIGFQTCEYYT